MSHLDTFAHIGGTQLACADAVPAVWGLLDPSIAPPLLYYAYIPIIFIALLFGVFVRATSRDSLAARLLLWIAILFSLLLMSELFLWIAVSAPMVHFVWQLLIIWHAVLVFVLLCFTYSFVTKAPMPSRWQWLLLLALLPIFLLAPTTFNVSAFDLARCESIQGPLWLYMYVVEIGALIGAALFCFHKSRHATTPQERTTILTLGWGLVAFFGIFILANALGDVTRIYDINLFSPLGMIALLATLAYLMVRYQAFQVRVLGAQALVGTLIALLFAALFVRSIAHVRSVLLGTLLTVLVLGVLLIRSVKREIAARIEIENLAGRLQSVNRILSHDVKATLGKNRDLFQALRAGDFGPVPDQAKSFVERAFADTKKLIDAVINILAAGHEMVLNPAPFDFKEAVLEVVRDVQSDADAKHLTMTTNIPHGDYTIIADRAQIVTHVLHNLIENAINYNRDNGSITITLAKTDASTVLFSIRDTGYGITEEDRPNIFQEGGRGKDALKINVHSSGYGLSTAKKTVEAHGGKIWFASTGIPGKGTTFFVELPVTTSLAAHATAV